MAEAGVLFLDTVAPIPLTGPSHTSIITGSHPIHHEALRNGNWLSPQSKTLPEILATYGYDTAAFVSGWTLKNQGYGLASRFHTYDDSFSPWQWLPDEAWKLEFLQLATFLGFKIGITSRLEERPAAQTTQSALQWLRRKADRPFFLWVHYFDPHVPYAPPPPYNTMHDPNFKGEINSDLYHLNASQREAWFQDKKAVRHMTALYEGEISFVDAEIGHLLTALKESRLESNTLIILTADHGESLGEHHSYFDHSDLYDTCLKVLLIFHFSESGRAA